MPPKIVPRGSRLGKGEVEILDFSYPHGVVASSVLRNPAGAVLDIRCLWGIQIVWYGDDDDCACFEYRQYFQAPAIRIETPDQETPTLRLAIGWEQTEGGEWVVVEHPLDTWVEDTQAVPDKPGVIRRYGYRHDDRRRSAGEFAPDGYDQPWVYQAVDAPHLSPLGKYPPGTRFVVDAAFKGQIINVCDGDQVVVETDEWYWRFDGQ